MHRRSGPRRIRCGGTGDLAPACEDAPVNQPRSIYESRLSARRGAAARLDRLDVGMSALRGLLVVVAALLVWLGPVRHTVTSLTLAIPAGLFLLALPVHDRLAARRTRIDRAIDLYQRALARLDGNWAGPRAVRVVAVTAALRRRTGAVTEAIGRPESHLALLAALVRVFEDEVARAGFEAPLLRALDQRLRGGNRAG